MSKAFRCWYCTGTGTIEVNEVERDCGHCGGTGLDGETLRNAAPDLLRALKDLVARCDGDEGVRADGSNIDTALAHVIIAKVEGGDA